MDKQKTVGIDFIKLLSGGNHELFHSNLLAFLAHHESEFFRTLFKYLGPIPEYDINFVGREKLKMDLTLWDKNHKHIVFALENKVKSFPNIQQLEGYNEKIEKTNNGEGSCLKVLLTLMVTPKDRLEIEKRGWKVMTYNDLISKMQDSNLRDKETYLAQFIADYVQYVKKLVEITNEAEGFVEKKTSKLSALYELLKNVKEQNENEKWKDVLKLRAIYHHIKKRIEEDLKNDKIKSLVTISHGSPLVELQVYLNPDSYAVLEEPNKNKDKVDKLEYYFIIFQDKKLLHGFRIWNNEAKKFKGRKKVDNPKRAKWLKEQWNQRIASDIGKKILSELRDNGINVNLNDYPRVEANKYKYPAFVFDDSAMPHIIGNLDSEPSLTVHAIIERMKQEITVAYKAVEEINNNKQ